MILTSSTTHCNFRHRMPANTTSRQRGLTLIEVMVAITISLIMLAGVIQLFVSNKQAYRIQESINSLQENGRFGLQFVSASLRMADNWGGIKASLITGAPIAGITGKGSCDSTWISTVTIGFQGYTGLGAGTTLLPTNCLIAAADYVSGSDLFVVRFAGADFAVTDSTLSPNTLSGTSFYIRSAVGHRAALFLGSAIGALPTDIYDSANPDAIGFFNYLYNTELYFIRPCSNPPAGSSCTAGDDGGNPIPTLVKYSLIGNTWIGPQPLAEGVEMMKLEYGIASSATSIDTAQYVSAATVATNWDRVRSVRVTLVVRANERDVGYTDSTAYTLPDGTTTGTTYTPAAAVQNYRRKVFTTVVQIRNRSRS